MYLEMLFSEIINIFTLFKSDQELKRGVLEERPAINAVTRSKLLSFMPMPCFLRKFKILTQNSWTIPFAICFALEVGPEFQQAWKLGQMTQHEGIILNLLFIFHYLF